MMWPVALFIIATRHSVTGGFKRRRIGSGQLNGDCGLHPADATTAGSSFSKTNISFPIEKRKVKSHAMDEGMSNVGWISNLEVSAERPH